MIDYSVAGSIAVLRLDAPPVNAITFAVLDELTASVRRANADPRVRGIVITGGTGHFSAGAEVALGRPWVTARRVLRGGRCCIGSLGFRPVSEGQPNKYAHAYAL